MNRTCLLRLLVGIFLVLQLSLAGKKEKKAALDSVTQSLEKVRQELPSLTLDSTTAYSRAIQHYFRYYNLYHPAVEHRFGIFTAESLALAAHFYIPPDSKGTVMVLHGYLSHTGSMSHLITFLLNQQFAVAAFDLPGHGLSGGERAAIDDFNTYSRILTVFLDTCQQQLPGPFHTVAHSTGGAAVVNSLLTGKAAGLDKIVLICPLVRSAFWSLSKAGYFLGGSHIKEIPRILMTKLSSDREYMDFIDHYDPLRPGAVPVIWIRALFDWNERVPDLAPVTKPMLVVQAGKDRVVDWRYNIPFLKEKFPSVRVKMIKKGRHELHNESRIMRDRVMTMIGDYLKAE